MSDTAPRTCFFIDETMWTPMGYIPSVVTEGEPGHSPLSGDPEKGQAPWYWGTSLEVARFTCDKANQEKGLTKKDVQQIITSSMAASNAEAEAARVDNSPHVVRIQYNTDFDGRPIDPGKEEYAETYHGPFATKIEALIWLNEQPDDTDVHDTFVIYLNNPDERVR